MGQGEKRELMSSWDAEGAVVLSKVQRGCVCGGGGMMPCCVGSCWSHLTQQTGEKESTGGSCGRTGGEPEDMTTRHRQQCRSCCALAHRPPIPRSVCAAPPINTHTHTLCLFQPASLIHTCTSLPPSHTLALFPTATAPKPLSHLW